MQHQLFTPLPVQPPATASQRWHGVSSILYSARVAVVHPGRCGDTMVDSVENELHLEGLTHHLAGCLAVPRASAATEVNVLMGSGSSITAISEELVHTGPAGAAGDDANRVNAGVCWECACGADVGPGV